MSVLTKDGNFPSTSSAASQEAQESSFTRQSPISALKVTLLSSEWVSTKGGLSTINRELAIHLAKHNNVEVSMYLPQCSEEDKRAAAACNVCIIEAEEIPGYDPIDWLATIPRDHQMDFVIGHGIHLGRQVALIKKVHQECKWIQVIHTDPEELGMFKNYADSIAKGEKKHQAEVGLCKLADQVVAIGPKQEEAFSCYLRSCGKDQDVLNLTPGIFSEFANVHHAAEERGRFRVLVFGRGDNENFYLKGYDIAARAVAELCKHEPHRFKLVFVGAPKGEEEKVKEMLLKEGIATNQLIVRSYKEREQLAAQFCEADLAIMPSRTEGFGLAALEALSAGLPVLVSGNSGFGDALKKLPFGSSCVVNSEEGSEWAKAIRRIHGSERKLRLRETVKIRESYAEEYHWERQCGRLVERMLNIIQETSTAPDQAVAAVNFGEQVPSSVSESVSYPDTTTKQHIVGDVVSSGIENVSSEGRSLLKQERRPLHPSATPPVKEQRHDTDIRSAMVRCLSSLCCSKNTAPDQAVAAVNLGEQGPSSVSESVSHPDATTIQHIVGDTVSSGRENGKKSRELRISGTTILNEGRQDVGSEDQQSFRKYGGSVIKLLIDAKTLEKEKKEAIEEMLTQIVQEYDDHSRDWRCLKPFTEHLIETYNVLVLNVCKGSIVVSLRCPTLESLEHLWSDYRSGDLDKLAERYLVTDDMKKKLNQETIYLKTTIDDENYLNCKKALMGLPSTCLENPGKDLLHPSETTTTEEKRQSTDLPERRLRKSVEHVDEVDTVRVSYFEPGIRQTKISSVERTEEVDTMKDSYFESKIEQGKFFSPPDQRNKSGAMAQPVQKMSVREELGPEMKPPSFSGLSIEEKSPHHGYDMVDAGSTYQEPNSKLLMPVTKLPYGIRGTICLKLDIKDDLHFRDSRLLGEKMGFSKDVTRDLEQRLHATNVLLQLWSTTSSKATVGRLIEMLKEKDFERSDVVEVLENWVYGKGQEW